MAILIGRRLLATRVQLLLGLAIAIAGQSSGQWVQTSGPEGGFASSLLNTGQSILLAAYTVYQSTDGGGTWIRSDVGLGPQTGGVSALAKKGSTVFCGTGNDGIYRSEDDGMTWQRSSSGIDAEVHIGSFTVGDSVMFAASESRGVFRSYDNGYTWVQVNGGLTDTVVTAILLRGAVVYVATWDQGVFKSDDYGASWSPVNSGLAGDGLHVLTLVGTSTSLLAGTRAGVYRSTDGGASWEQAASGLTSEGVSILFENGLVVFGGTYGSGVFRSTDDGVNWDPTNSGLDNLNIRAVVAKGDSLFVGTYGGSVVSLSTNGGLHWTASGRGIVSSLNYGIAALGGKVISAVYDGIHATTNNGDTWLRSDSGFVGNPAYSLWVRGGDVYMGSTSYGVFRSADSGVSWTPANGGLTGAAQTVWSMTDDGTALYAGTSGGVYRSTNNGDSWLPSKNGLTDTLTVSLLATSGTLFAGTWRGLYRSTNQGADWAVLSPGIPAHYVSDLASIGTVVIAAMPSGVYRSTDNGDSWMPATVGISPEAGNVLALRAYGDNLFAGTGLSRAYVSSDSGMSWTDISSGLLRPGIGIQSMVAANGYLWAATTSSGVWKRDLSEITVDIGVGGGFPERFALFQNYPNPFNPTTTIQYALPHRSHLTLAVFNSLGQQVAILVSGEIGAGHHSVQFDGSNLASGVYFYRLQAGSYMATKKFLLIR
ncbi:MAG: hypothetical protein H6Q30_2348 [Bacteroidetes bacterium]|nr:hypothetical protein [Bacteroidota bacterium]